MSTQNNTETISISVIIPIYNVEKYLAVCIESVLAQSFQDFEIILVDDNSPDNSKNIVDDFIQRYPSHRIHYIKHKTNIGLGATRNTGIAASKGEYLYFLDSDDFIHKDALFVLYKKITSQKDIDIVIGGYKPVSDKEYTIKDVNDIARTQTSDKNHIYKKEILLSNNDILHRLGYMISKGGIPPAVWGRLYIRKLFLDSKNTLLVPFLEKGYAQDLGTSPRILLHCKKILLIKENYYYYRIRENAATTTMTVDHKIRYTKDVINAINCVRDYFVEHKLYDTYKDFLERLYYSNIGNAIFRNSYPDDIQRALLHLYYETCAKELSHPYPMLSFKGLYAMNTEIMRYPHMPPNTAKRWLWFASRSPAQKLVTLIKWFCAYPIKKLLKR